MNPVFGGIKLSYIDKDSQILNKMYKTENGWMSATGDRVNKHVHVIINLESGPEWAPQAKLMHMTTQKG